MELYESHWPVPSPKGVVVLVHGAGEHCGRYDHVARCLNDAGYAVLGQDLPGLGRSPGRRGHVDSFEQYLQGVDQMLHRVDELYADTPHFLYGHSMGGLIVVRWLQTRPNPTTRALSGVILSSPCLDLSLPVKPSMIRVASTLERVWPTLSQSNKIPASAVSRHPEIVEKYASDPLIQHKVTVKWFMELQRSMAAARAGEAACPAPMLILQAGADKLVSPAATAAYAARLEAPGKNFRNYEGLYHELHNEPEQAEILSTIVAFLDERTAATSPVR